MAGRRAIERKKANHWIAKERTNCNRMKQRSVPDGLSKSKDTKQAWQKDGARSRQRQSKLELPGAIQDRLRPKMKRAENLPAWKEGGWQPRSDPGEPSPSPAFLASQQYAATKQTYC